MKVLMAGGGTGGHVYPAVTIAKALQEKGAEVLFAGTERGLEAKIVPREGFAIEFIPVDYFPRRLSWRLVRALGTAARAVLRAREIIRRFDPDVCVGTGGYVAGPVVLAAALLGKATVIQEQNAFPGLTNRILARFADKVALGYEVAAERLPSRDKLVVTGNPVRPEIVRMTREEGARRLGLEPGRRRVLIFGASQGAASINRAVIEARDRLQALDAEVILAAGERGYPRVVQALRDADRQVEPVREGVKAGNLRVLPYIYDMPAALASCDLVVGRAGALSIAEITARGLPAVLIPFPHATANHQEKNARVLEAAGAARVILDRELTAERLAAILEELLASDAERARMAAASRKLGRPDAVWEIVALIEGVVALRGR